VGERLELVLTMGWSDFVAASTLADAASVHPPDGGLLTCPSDCRLTRIKNISIISMIYATTFA